MSTESILKKVQSASDQNEAQAQYTLQEALILAKQENDKDLIKLIEDKLKDIK